MSEVDDLNIDAYRIMAEILVTVRRIIQRGLEKASGASWYLDGCPTALFERLIARKENEVAIDRFDRDYQELLSYASMDDLAEIIEYNRDLAHLLSNIEPEGTSMAERCRQIETLRLKLDAAVPFGEDDVEALLGYYQDFQSSLSKSKKPAKSAKASAPAPEPVEEEPPSTVEPMKRPPAVEPVKAPPPVEPVKPPPPVEPVTPPPPVEPVTPPPPAEPVSPPEELIRDEAQVEQQAGESGISDTEVDELGAEDLVSDDIEEDGTAAEAEEIAETDEVADESDEEKVDSGVIRAAEEAAAEDDLALEAVRAMADDDQAEVLRILHREVMSVAEHVLKGTVDQEFSVWQTITISGWFDIKKEPLGLTSVESFFSIAEEIRTKLRAGESENEIKAFINQSEVTKLLLSLGETFKRQNL
jgi:hypothetical protein